MSKSDRELLELAAMAAGISGYRYSDSFRCMAHWNESDGGWFDACGLWDPLTDDGDALRLAVRLGIVVQFHKSHNTATANRIEVEADELVDFSPAAATRRAIVRAAAAIGETLP